MASTNTCLLIYKNNVLENLMAMIENNRDLGTGGARGAMALPLSGKLCKSALSESKSAPFKSII